ncbi:U3-containing 90S pre-ribosomal complex subunit-domain containing protein [Lentinula raphanica]|uniref:U3-containing 90S pre-ribosomal complex subunit-domain containing protein n=1 Tax=Lentinula raphanica TaxID=153919 RepID=A0AA38PAS5_9AGAR|nr:U3-containing 90S pre-ribosomal complex subunit-domain containing protein [Lentinula raphanica]KAJ3773857.1 U3-containing 90S pre-ribosomal complex subunit-domain containing protein [Lentinula raphanica]KAJ3839463.1 U3-containing 90S pre-ribosomal complex subunit-domain containing protein [Lentinula raphanica]
MTIGGGGDDLDDFVLDDEYFAPSGDELDETEDTPSQEDRPVASSSSNIADDAQKTKKRKQREKNKERKAKRRKVIESAESEQPHSIAQRSPHELAEYMSAMQAKTFDKSTALELEDMRIPDTSIADTTSWTGPRTLDYLSDFIIKTIPNLHTRLSQKSKNPGSPTLLFITGAALRVADVTRILKDKRLRGDKGGEVAKLFARHFKLAEHCSYLKRTKVGAAVGTPGRIGKLLIETDALTISALSHIMLDISFRDAKKRNLLDIPETRDEVFRTVLGGPKISEAISSGKIQLVLF